MMKELRNIEKELNNKFMERSEVIRASIVALLARQHMVLVGPPGIAKSAIIRDLVKSVVGANYFEWLLSKFSTPEELFGPVLLSELEKGIYSRNVANKLPEAHVAFLDETFKANSAILNALLTIVNERVYHNNGSPKQVPLMSLFGASNEYPDADEGLDALFDRFLIRFEVKPISEERSFETMLSNSLNGVNNTQNTFITTENLNNLQDLATKVTVPMDVIQEMSQIKYDLSQEGIFPTDRRWVESLKVIKANACYKGKSTADVSDLDILKHILWKSNDEIVTVADIVTKHTVDQFTQTLQQFLKEAEEIKNNVLADPTPASGQEAIVKIKAINNDLDNLSSKYPDRQEAIRGIKDAVATHQKIVLKESLGIDL